MPTMPLMLIAALSAPNALIEAPVHSTWGAGDQIVGSLAAAAGGVAGAFAGGYVGALVGKQLCDPDEVFGCLGAVGAGGWTGGVILSNLGAATAVSAYGAATDHEGAFVGALAGSAVGQLGGGLIGAGLCAAHKDLCAAGLGVAMLTQAIGAGIGYGLTVDDPAGGPVAHGGLLDYDPAHGLRLGAPSGGFTPDTEGGYTLGLTVAAGRF